MRAARFRWSIIAGGVAGFVLAVSAGAQAPARRDTVPWITHRDVIGGAAALAVTLALAPFDRRISNEFTEPEWRRGTDRQWVAGKVAALGGEDPFVLSGVLYAAGAVTDKPAFARFGLHSIEAVALGGGIAGLIRGFTGRALPNVNTREAFSFGRGFHDGNGPFVSFPSGHTTAAFAMAAVISGETRAVSPRVARVAGPVAFALAAAVGFARVAQRDHWPTDLPLAAAIGTWSGEAIESHASNRGLLWRAARGITLSPGGDGRRLIGWSLRPGQHQSAP